MKLLAALILGAFTATLLVLVGMSRRGVVAPVRFVEPYDPEAMFV